MIATNDLIVQFEGKEYRLRKGEKPSGLSTELVKILTDEGWLVPVPAKKKDEVKS